MVQTLCLSSGKPCTSSTCVGLLVASCPNRPIPPRIEKQFIPLASGRHRSKKDSTNQAKRPSIRPSDDPTEPETSIIARGSQFHRALSRELPSSPSPPPPPPLARGFGRPVVRSSPSGPKAPMHMPPKAAAVGMYMSNTFNLGQARCCVRASGVSSRAL